MTLNLAADLMIKSNIVDVRADVVPEVGTDGVTVLYGPASQNLWETMLHHFVIHWLGRYIACITAS